jgi:tRNA dimethylallyltransferase
LIIICGPTGSGKTGFAIDLAQRFRGEIVGADSMQIYRYMDIGTAKPTRQERLAAAHHMIDIVDPDQDFDAAAYAEMADDCIRKIMKKGKTAFLVGGTGFYIKALVYGLFAEGPSDPRIRSRLQREAEREGAAALHGRLRGVDGPTAEKIHPNDAYRTIRALEVFEVTGRPLSEFQQRHGFREKRFTTLEIGLSWPRPTLYERINRRVDLMMAQGFYQEVQGLLNRGYAPEVKAMQSLGYRHLVQVICGNTPLTEAVALIKRDHRRYAKRQLTWFGARDSVHWVNPDQKRIAREAIRSFL